MLVSLLPMGWDGPWEGDSLGGSDQEIVFMVGGSLSAPVGSLVCLDVVLAHRDPGDKQSCLKPSIDFRTPAGGAERHHLLFIYELT